MVLIGPPPSDPAESALFEIDHRDPSFRITRTLLYEGTNVVCYSLQEGGKILIAFERMRSAKLQHDNRRVFDRQE